MVVDASSFWAYIQRYEDMLAEDPRSRCFARLSLLYRKLGLLDDAISVAKKGCGLHPDYSGGFFALGAAYYDHGLIAEARLALERSLALKANDLQTHKLLGQLYAGAGEVALAKRMLGPVLQQNPNDLESQMLLRSLGIHAADLESDEELLEEAEVIEELTDVVENLPEVDDLEGDRHLLMKQKEPVPLSEFEGLPEEEAPQLEEPEEPDQLWAIEQPKEAPPAAKTSTRNPLATATLAELYVSQGFIDKALAVYRDLSAADPDNASYQTRIAALNELGEPQQEALHPAPSAVSLERSSHAEPTATPGELEMGLNSWLENIRRRRDGV
jgi:tetratricopeptide (TPR) repeat protein